MESPSRVRGHRLVGLVVHPTPGGPPLLDDLAVPVDREPVAHRGGDGRADPVDRDRGQRAATACACAAWPLAPRLASAAAARPPRLLRRRPARPRRRPPRRRSHPAVGGRRRGVSPGAATSPVSAGSLGRTPSEVIATPPPRPCARGLPPPRPRSRPPSGSPAPAPGPRWARRGGSTGPRAPATAGGAGPSRGWPAACARWPRALPALVRNSSTRSRSSSVSAKTSPSSCTTPALSSAVAAS